MKTYALEREQGRVRRNDSDTGEIGPQTPGPVPVPQRASGAGAAVPLLDAVRARRRELEILQSAMETAEAARSRAEGPDTAAGGAPAAGHKPAEPMPPLADMERLSLPELLLLRPQPRPQGREPAADPQAEEGGEEPPQATQETAKAPLEVEEVEDRQPEPVREPKQEEPEEKAPAAAREPVPMPRGPRVMGQVAPASPPRIPGPLVFEVFPQERAAQRFRPADTPTGGGAAPPDDGEPAKTPAAAVPQTVQPGVEERPAAETISRPVTDRPQTPAQSDAQQQSPGPKPEQEIEKELAEAPDQAAKDQMSADKEAEGMEPNALEVGPPQQDAPDALDVAGDGGEPAAPSGPGGGGLGGAPELDAWKSRASQAAVDIDKPDLGPVEPRTKGMAEHGKKTLAGGAKRRREMPGEANNALVETKRDLSEIGKVPEALKDDPVGAVKAIEAAAEKGGLPPQQLPLLRPTPRGFLPNLYGDPISPADFTALKKKYEKYLPPKGKRGKDFDEMDALLKAFKKDLATNPALKGRVAVFEGQTVSGVDLPPRPEIAPAHQPDIAAVLARIITDSKDLPKSFIDSARKTAYASGALAVPESYPDIGKEWVPQEAELLRAEMERVREAAGISKEQLDKAVSERQEQLKKDKTKAVGEGDKVYETVKEKVEADFEETGGTIQGLRREWESWADERATRESKVDWKAIRDRQYKMERAVEDLANDWIVAYDDMRKERLKKLSKAAGEQKNAYVAAIKKEKAIDLQEAGDDKKKIEAIEADKSYDEFVKKQVKIVDKAVKKHDSDNSKQVGKWQRAMRKVRKSALDRLQIWGDEQVGRTRTWIDELMAKVFKWRDDQKSEARAFARQRASENTAALGSNLDLLRQVRGKFGESLDEAEKEQLSQMGEEQRTVIQTYYTNGGDTIGAVAAGLAVRLRDQRVPKIEQAMVQKVRASPVNSGSNAPKLMGLSSKGFSVDAGAIAAACKQGFEHRWGTDEDKIHGALAKVSALEVGMAVRGAYFLDTGQDFNARLKDELAGGMFDDEEEYDQAKAQLEANKIDAAAAELRVAMEGLGTNEDKIKDVLRRFQGQKTDDGKPIDLELIKQAYRRMYGESLDERLEDELSGADLGISQALADNNEEKADAIELKEAQTGFWGPDKKDIEKVYQRVHDEEWARGKAQNLTVEEIEANIRKRLDDTSTEYSDTYEGADLKEDFKKLPKNLADLAVGLQDQDWPAVDAARLEIERRGIYGSYTDEYGNIHKTQTLYADDKVINKDILGVQYDRAYEKRQWELERKLRNDEQEWNQTHPKPWSAAERRRRMEQLKREASQLAQADAKVSMQAFKSKFMERYEPGRDVSEFDDLLLSLTSGTSEGLFGTTWIAGTGHDEAKERLKRGGYLPPHLQIEYATKGPGTDDDRLKAQLRGKTKAEIAEIRRQWEAMPEHQGQSFDQMVLGELSGRDRFDVRMMLKYGEPTNPVEALALAREKRDYEARTGGMRGQGVFARKTSEYVDLENQVKRLEADAAAWKAAQERYPTSWEYDKKSGRFVETQAMEAGAYENAWQATFQGVKEVVELHRQAVDADADLISGVIGMVVAVALAAVLAPFTAGASLAVLALVAAGVAAASTAMTMLTKWAIKGDAYSNGEIATDLAFGVVDMAVSAATAGVGGKLMRGAIAAKLAAEQGGKAASKEVIKKAVKEASMMTGKQAVASVAQETAQGLFSVFAVPAVMDEYGRGMNPMLNMIVSMGLGMGAGIGISHGIGKLGELLPKRPGKARFPDAGEIDLGDVRYNPKRLAAMQDEYLKVNPGRNADDFLHDYDALLLKQMEDPKVQAKWQKQARDDMLQYIPKEQKARLSETPIEMMGEKAFRKLTGSRKGEAVVVIKDGVPVVVVRQGASPTALRRESPHLLQSLDEKWKGHFKRLDEGNLANWKSKDTREKFRLYGDKLDVEIDAAEADLKLMRGLAKDPDAPPGIAREIAEVEHTLYELDKRLFEVQQIGPLRRTLMAWGVWPEPQYLGQKPRLFAKKGKGPWGRRGKPYRHIEVAESWNYDHDVYKISRLEHTLDAVEEALERAGKGKKLVLVPHSTPAKGSRRYGNLRMTDAAGNLLDEAPVALFVRDPASRGTGSGGKWPFDMEPNPLGYPPAPDGHYYIKRRKSDGSFDMSPDGHHYLDLETFPGAKPGKRYAGVDLETGELIDATDLRSKASWDDVDWTDPDAIANSRKGALSEGHTEPFSAAKVGGKSGEGFLLEFEQRLGALPFDGPEHLQQANRGVLRRWARLGAMVDLLISAEGQPPGLKEAAKGLSRDGLLDELFSDLEKHLKSLDEGGRNLNASRYDTFRQAIRDRAAQVLGAIDALPKEQRDAVYGHIGRNLLDALTDVGGLSGSNTARPKAGLLDLFLDFFPEPASKGNFFTEYRKSWLQRRGIAFDPDVTIPSLKHKMPEGAFKSTRTWDGVSKLADDFDADFGPPPGKTVFLDDKAGPGAFRAPQALDYGLKAKAGGVVVGGVKIDSTVYVADTLENAQKALKRMGNPPKSDLTAGRRLLAGQGVTSEALQNQRLLDAYKTFHNQVLGDADHRPTIYFGYRDPDTGALKFIDSHEVEYRTPTLDPDTGDLKFLRQFELD